MGDVILTKFKLIQAFIVVLIYRKNEEDPFKKMKALEWSQHFSHYFPDAKGQLIPQSKIRSSRISNPSKILWVSLLPARMK